GLPTHIELDSNSFALEKDSVILLEQVRTIDKRRLKEKIAHLDDQTMEKIDEALQISLGLSKV
ncbi:MAG TPA: PemK family transcriptional regulator, partial [Firmicutes bacterium]|nr:PemK family transcriptional regulator [Bacillota bacterium]